MKFIDIIRTPKMNSGFKSVWARNFLYFRKTWTVSLFWILLEPLMYLGAIGFGLGAFVANIGGHSYIDFFFPGLLCSTGMMVAFFEGTYGGFTKLTHQKTYATIMLTRIGPEEIAVGELLWSCTKGYISVCGVAFVASLFGLIESWRILPALLILLVMCWLFASIAMIMTSIARNYDSFIYSTSGFIVPMSLLSGTYFPIEQLPGGLRYVAYLFPLTHAVQAVRGLLHEGFTTAVWLHTLVLLTLGFFAMNIAIYRIRGKLLK
ncbi:ABC transporter permease [Bdellovibrio sp. HCB337]|uniref:ABC transporter permease n=1 Tax=Bdellovibrio sp. HCB337 TaxID=3394358 RepID=UPI0039A702E6